MSLDSDDVSLAFVIQKDGLDALGTDENQDEGFGGASGIRDHTAAIVFEPATQTIKLVDSSLNTVKKATLVGLSKAKNLEVEISLTVDTSSGSL